jgi:hypothetical protein
MNNYIFVGKKNKPSFLLEFIKKLNKVYIYQPDKYSLRDKELDFFEKYYLGNLVSEIQYDEFVTKDKLIDFNDCYYTPEIIIKTKKDYILINKSIIKLKIHKKL